MKKPSVALYLLVAALLCLVTGVNASADIINLEDQTGPSLFAAASAQTLNYSTSSGPLTITGGTVLTGTTNLPADETSVYGTASFGNSLSNTITMTFTSPINNFFFDLLNGRNAVETFTVADNLGNTQSFNLAPNLSLGVVTVGFPTVGSVITITMADPEWDFFIDNIGFNQATPGTATPEPGTMLLLGVGVLGLAAVKLMKR
ncbi:MAG TPA: PEP-CTERM sorting domain-containing protein [Candidatus Angelobacter sp.]|nr:PEP-CTERM sorting domain-containing protein [Candidatus Angelobacter sp.]